jgi:WD40 repeat protein
MAETASCVTSLAFHPVIPSILAGGTFNGEIIIWRIIENQDPVITSSAMTEDSHQEPISQLIWTVKDDDKYQLISVGYDGKVLIWDITNKLSQPIQMTVVGTKSIPRLLKIQMGSAPLGIKCISWPREKRDDYLIGTETGYVLRCLSKKSESNQIEKSNEYLSSPKSSGIFIRSACWTMSIDCFLSISSKFVFDMLHGWYSSLVSFLVVYSHFGLGALSLWYYCSPVVTSSTVYLCMCLREWQIVYLRFDSIAIISCGGVFCNFQGRVGG